MIADFQLVAFCLNVALCTSAYRKIAELQLVVVSVMGHFGIVHHNTREGWLQTATHSSQNHYRRRFYEVANGLSAPSLAGMLHKSDGIMHGRTIQMIFSVTGGAANSFNDISEDVIASVAQDIVRTAATYHALVVTGGTSTGIMQLVGKTFQKKADSHGVEIPCIGVAASSRILAGRRLAGSDDEEVLFTDAELRASRHSGSVMKEYTPPELRGHLGFILVKDQASEASQGDRAAVVKDQDSEVSQRDRAAALLRAQLERAYAEVHKIPIATIVVGGGPVTLKTVQSAVQSHDHVFIVKGSGGIADALVKMYEAVVSDDIIVRTSAQQELGEVDYLREHILTIMQVCYSAKRANNLHIIDYRDNMHSSCCQVLLKQSIIAILGRCRTHSVAQDGFAIMWDHYVEQLVKDNQLGFLLETLQVVFHDLESNSSVAMGPQRTQLEAKGQLEVIRTVVLSVLRADLNTLDPKNVFIVSSVLLMPICCIWRQYTALAATVTIFLCACCYILVERACSPDRISIRLW